MSFDCSRMLRKCRAECCGTIPLDIDFVARVDKKFFHGEIVSEFSFTGAQSQMMKIYETKDGLCVFLNRETRKCSVYEDRPKLCRLFGTEVDTLMTCEFQDRNGSPRNKHERAEIRKKLGKEIDRFLAGKVK